MAATESGQFQLGGREPLESRFAGQGAGLRVDGLGSSVSVRFGQAMEGETGRNVKFTSGSTTEFPDHLKLRSGLSPVGGQL
jgi:hypothetical protein